jgi:hypothetical protein
MALCVLTIHDPSPAPRDRSDELRWIRRALDRADRAISNGGRPMASGEVTDVRGTVVASYVYTPVAEA